jgi:hypothetical protein
MAVNMMASNGQVRYHVDEYVIDTPNDLKNMPRQAAPGSVAICTSNSEVYMKNNSGEWVAI